MFKNTILQERCKMNELARSNQADCTWRKIQERKNQNKDVRRWIETISATEMTESRKMKILSKTIQMTNKRRSNSAWYLISCVNQSVSEEDDAICQKDARINEDWNCEHLNWYQVFKRRSRCLQERIWKNDSWNRRRTIRNRWYRWSKIFEKQAWRTECWISTIYISKLQQQWTIIKTQTIEKQNDEKNSMKRRSLKTESKNLKASCE